MKWSWKGLVYIWQALQLLNFHSNSKDLKCFCYYIYFAIEFAMRTNEVLVLDLVASPVWKLGKIYMESSLRNLPSRDPGKIYEWVNWKAVVGGPNL